MAKNKLSSGDKLTAAAVAGGVVSGEGYLIGASLMGVASETKAAGELVSYDLEGEYEMGKLSTDVMAAGDKVNWNNTNKEFQAATSDLDGCATVMEAAGSSITKVKVKLTQV